MIPKRLVFFALVAVACVAPARAAEPVEFPLWADGAPGESATDKKVVPTLTVYLPDPATSVGLGMVVAPGGGYAGLAMDHEGKQIADWLNANGMAAFVLKYRHAPDYAHPVPHMDASRAMRTVRARATEWGINPKRIGMIGFSAGGHLTATLSTQYTAGDAESADPIERVSTRPDHVVLMYPVITMNDPYTHTGSRKNLLGENPTPEMMDKMSAERNVDKNTPPAFIFFTQDDQAVPVENGLMYYIALCAHKVPAELHVYRHGRHGVGLAKDDPVLNTWPDLFLAWLKNLPEADEPKP